jgi:hypothetical protein
MGLETVVGLGSLRKDLGTVMSFVGNEIGRSGPESPTIDLNRKAPGDQDRGVV